MSDEYLTRPMSRADALLLTPEEKRERKLAQNRNKTRTYRKKNPEKIKEDHKKYRENNLEKCKESVNNYYRNNTLSIKAQKAVYNQTSGGKKLRRLSRWAFSGLRESKEDLEWIYDLYLHQELCYSCDVKMTRGVQCATEACMDHSHTTNRFRQICCRACNNNDGWMQWWC